MMSISTPEDAVRKGGFASPFGSRCYVQGQNVAAWEPSLYCGNPNGGNLAEGDFYKPSDFDLTLQKPGPASTSPSTSTGDTLRVLVAG